MLAIYHALPRISSIRSGKDLMWHPAPSPATSMSAFCPITQQMEEEEEEERVVVITRVTVPSFSLLAGLHSHCVIIASILRYPCELLE